jgi:methyltransferase OMS1
MIHVRPLTLALGASGALVLGTFVGNQYLVGPPQQKQAPSERARHDTFDALAKKWDSMVRFDELTTGIRRLRRRLVLQARGDVLEVAVGSGRNFSYYNTAKVHSLVAVDFSRSMLEVVDGKRQELEPIKLRIKLATTHALDFEDRSFDTVVDTFGVCSFEDPVKALREMRRVLKDDGKMLLLEHGASSWGAVQGYMNRGVHRHAEKYGCFPNRHITDLVREAGLHVVSEERKHFGTTYMLVCMRDPPVEE